MLTASALRERVHYDPDTGIFRYRIVPRGISPAQAALPIGALGGNGYLSMGLAYKKYYLHRLAWLYMTGEWPREEIDHEDTDRLNNRWSNLREANSRVNKENQRRAKSHNTSGLLGVSRKRNKFEAVIHVDHRRHRLGMFASAIDAHAAYLAAKRQLHEGNTL